MILNKATVYQPHRAPLVQPLEHPVIPDVLCEGAGLPPTEQHPGRHLQTMAAGSQRGCKQSQRGAATLEPEDPTHVLGISQQTATDPAPQLNAAQAAKHLFL